ncbi:MAG TPA: periplasmic heavy metal sensor [Candidatus Krumholzibacteria bacterium]|nr:periplasmic heavy metal sensor [Candidatus Krumholzibacteria bacterium]
MKVKVLIAALIVLIVFNVAALGAFFFFHVHGHHQPKQLDRAHRFALRYVPEKDREKFFRTARRLHQDIGPLADQTRDLEKQLINSMRQDPVPRAHIDSLLEQISKNRLEIARTATDRMIAMGDSLTPDERGHMADALLRFRNLGSSEHWKP